MSKTSFEAPTSTIQKPPEIQITPGTDQIERASTKQTAVDVFGAESGTADTTRIAGQAPELYLDATLLNFGMKMRSARDAVAGLNGGATNTPAEFRRAIDRVDQLRQSFDHPGLGAVAADAGRIDDVKQAIKGIGEALAGIERAALWGRIEPSAKIRPMLADLVNVQIAAMDLAATLNVKLPDLEASGLTGQIQSDLQPRAEAFKRTGWAHYNKGKLAHLKGNTPVAAAHLLEALNNLERMDRADPGNNDTHTVFLNRSGMVHHQLGDDTRAVELYDQAIAANDGKYVPGHFNAASAHLNLGDKDRALTEIERSVGHAKDSEQATYMRGLAAGDIDLAGLIGEPRYQALVEPVGGSTITKMPADTGTRPLFRTAAWHYEAPASELLPMLSDLVAALDASAQTNNVEGHVKPSAGVWINGPGGLGSLEVSPKTEDPREGLHVWNGPAIDSLDQVVGHTFTIHAERVVDSAAKSFDLATLTLSPDGKSVSIDIARGDRLSIDPYAVHTAIASRSTVREPA